MLHEGLYHRVRRVLFPRFMPRLALHLYRVHHALLRHVLAQYVVHPVALVDPLQLLPLLLLLHAALQLVQPSHHVQQRSRLAMAAPQPLARRLHERVLCISSPCWAYFQQLFSRRTVVWVLHQTSRNEIVELGRPLLRLAQAWRVAVGNHEDCLA